MTGVDTFAVQPVLDGTHDRSHPVTADLRAHLDRLDTALAAATPGPWWHDREALAANNETGDFLFDHRDVVLVEDHPEGVASCIADGELIVAAVNALPGLLAAVRAAADLVAFYDRHEYSTLNVDDLRTALAAALPEGDAP